MNTVSRSDSDHVVRHNRKPLRGKLTLFLGAMDGVGKTHAMLEKARERISEGLDVASGMVNTHGRPDIEALLADIEIVSPRRIEYQGMVIEELDLEEILRRHPQIVLVDDLAHRNVHGVRHQYRYLDVDELLQGGIDVYTTINIQNVESQNDIAAQISGVRAEETVPDKFLDGVDQVALVDIPAEELVNRFRNGKVTAPDHGRPWPDSFYQTGNINALRELALRYTARRVGKQMEDYRLKYGIDQPWPVQERVMACISTSPFAVHVLRQARRIANDLKAELMAVYIEPPFSNQSAEDQVRLSSNLQLAEELGAKVITMRAQDVASGILSLARQYNVSQIILGKPLRSRWKELFRGPVVDDIIRGCTGIGVFIVPGNPAAKESHPNIKKLTDREKSPWTYLLSLLLIALVTLIGYVYGDYLGLTNIGMLYLLPVVLVSTNLGVVPSITAAVISVVAFDLFFVPPVYRLAVDDIRYLITFAVFMVVAFTTGNMADRLRGRMKEAIQRETRTKALYDLARGLSAVTDLEILSEKVVRHIAETVDAEAVMYLPGVNGLLRIIAASDPSSGLTQGPHESETAEWCYRHSHRCGTGTDTIPDAQGLYLPIMSEEKILGVLGVQPKNQRLEPEQIYILDALSGLAALAVARLEWAAQTQKSNTLEESERLSAALFNSISHDMKTPLASILGAVNSLVDDGDLYNPEQKSTLLMSIRQGAVRLNRVVTNLLDMARLESGYMKLHTDWYDLQDIIGVTIRENHDFLQGHCVKVEIPGATRLVRLDYGLIEQVLTNLLHNAVKYSPAQTEILIRVTEEPDFILISVADQGSGINPDDADRIFDKFYRLQSPLNVSGTGLGLSICRGIVEAHGGRIWAENQPGGGAIMRFTLPIEEAVPALRENNL